MEDMLRGQDKPPRRWRGGTYAVETLTESQRRRYERIVAWGKEQHRILKDFKAGTSRARMHPQPYEERLVVFVDVLGWGSLVETSARVGKGTKKALAKINEAAELISFLREYAKNHNDLTVLIPGDASASDNHNVQVSHFSDTFVMSAPLGHWADEPITSVVEQVCLMLLSRGMYFRGAIVVGMVQHRGDVLFGPAVQEAYVIERDVAKYPRIVVTPEARRHLRPECVVQRDHDALDFLDVLAQLKAENLDWLMRRRGEVAAKLRRDRRNLGLVEKHGWLLNYIDATRYTLATRKEPGMSRARRAAKDREVGARFRGGRPRRPKGIA